MKASKLVKMLQQRIDIVGDLEVEIVKVEGGFAEGSKPIASVSTDGECAIYLEYRNVLCPVCDIIWAVTDNTKDETTQVCADCKKIVEDKNPEAMLPLEEEKPKEQKRLKFHKPDKGKYLELLPVQKDIVAEIKKQDEKDMQERYFYGTKGRKKTNEGNGEKYE